MMQDNSKFRDRKQEGLKDFWKTIPNGGHPVVVKPKFEPTPKRKK